MNALILLPWTPKLVYGIFLDTFPICGSRKKNYIIIAGAIQALGSVVIALIKFDSAWAITGILIGVNVA